MVTIDKIDYSLTCTKISIETYSKINGLTELLKKHIHFYRNNNIPGMVTSSIEFRKHLMTTLKWVRVLKHYPYSIKLLDKQKISNSITTIIISLKMFAVNQIYRNTCVSNLNEKGQEICYENILFLETLKECIAKN